MAQLAVTTGPELLSAGRHQKADLMPTGATADPYIRGRAKSKYASDGSTVPPLWLGLM
jgi:hypothetical protein